MNGRYEILEKLSAGAMGVVYRAWDRLRVQEVAIKSIQIANIRRDSEFDKLSLKRHLTDEFQIMASMRHPNIITVRDFGFSDDGDTFFVMDLLDSPIDVVAAAAQCSDEIKLSMLIQILQALSYLHRRGLVHRDLKPDNILVTPEYIVKVIDFGLASEGGQQTIVAGTPNYIAPEILLRKVPTATSDIFAVGVIAYEMFSQKHPFKDEDKNWVQSTFENEPDLNLLPETFSFSLPNSLSFRIVIQKLLEKSPKDRYPTTEAAILDLSPLAGEAIPNESLALRESFLRTAKFIGRKEPLSYLEDAAMKLSMGRGSAWLIGGESGVGKSRLCDEIRNQALVQGVLVLRGQAHEEDPFALWRTPLEQLLLWTKLDADEASHLQDFIPNLAQILGTDIEPMPEMSNASYEQALIRLIPELFRRQERPILLILEDLQWANLAMLEDTITLTEQQSLMILANYQLEAHPDLPQVFPNAISILLEPFSAQEIADLSQSMLGDLGKIPEILNLLTSETTGNAYFVTEVVRALAEESGGLQAVGNSSITLKAEQTSIIRRRLKSVPNWAYKGLELSALVGRELDLQLLDKILAPNLRVIPPKEIPLSLFSTHYQIRQGISLDDWLLLCANAAILEVHDNRWRFCHDKLRQQILADMPANLRHGLENQILKARH